LALLAVVAASPLVIVSFHAAMQRAAPGAPPQKVAAAACALCVVPVVGACWLGLGRRDAPALVYAAVTYFAIAYSYFHLFNMSETARRIRILQELRRTGGMREEELRELYTEGDVVGVRLERMVAMGQLVRRGERFVLGGRALYFAARVVLFWRVLLGFERGGAAR
jgi:hypothetical protein